MGNIEIKQQKLPNHHIQLTRITYPIFWQVQGYSYCLINQQPPRRATDVGDKLTVSSASLRPQSAYLSSAVALRSNSRRWLKAYKKPYINMANRISLC
jgi:hypothetical protein